MAINSPIFDSILTYEKKPELFEGSEQELKIGTLVLAPLGKRIVEGVYLGENPGDKLEKDLLEKIRPLKGFHPFSYCLHEEYLALFSWMAKYYHYELGKLIFDCLPKLDLEVKEHKRVLKKAAGPPLKPNASQEKILRDLGAFEEKAPLFKKEFRAHLIHGVTGSGKSIVYLKIMKRVLEEKKSILFILPEINLTPQFTAFFTEQLGGEIYLYHSGVSAKKKKELFSYLKNTENPCLIIGARSSVFLPIANLGLIVMDEEHDLSYKQDDRCLYHARDVCLMLARLRKIPILLGSATPSLETFYNFKVNAKGKYHQLGQRFEHGKMAKIQVLSLREENYHLGHWPLADKTIEEITESLKAGDQVLLLINKLGFAEYLQCRSCGEKFKCKNCSLGLKVYLRKRVLSCTYCQYRAPLPAHCFKCNSLDILNKGYGTEKVAEVLTKAFPEKMVERFDREALKTPKKIEAKLQEFNEGAIDIFVGTQMLAKGHNFKKVNLVVVLGIDKGLNFCDFRSNEKTFQLLTQVAGRSGRYSDKGKVFIQSLNPGHDLFKYLGESNENRRFFHNELEVREMTGFPPFARLAQMNFYCSSQVKLQSFMQQLHLKLKNHLSQRIDHKVRLLGIRPHNVEKRKNTFSWFLLLSSGGESSELAKMHGMITMIQKTWPLPSGIQVKVDIDPYNFF